MSSRTYRSSGYGYGSVTELPEVPGIERAYRAYRRSGYGYECTEVTEVPGTGMNALQNLQKFFVG